VLRKKHYFKTHSRLPTPLGNVLLEHMVRPDGAYSTHYMKQGHWHQSCGSGDSDGYV